MANSTVFKINEIEPANVNIKKPTIYFQKQSEYFLTIFDLYYNNKPILIMSNRLQICKKTDNSIKFVDTQSTSCLHSFASLLRTLLTRVEKTSLYEKMIKEKSYHSMFDESDNQLLIRDINQNDTIVFDSDTNEIPLHRLQFQDNVRVILYLKNMWINEQKLGFNIKVSQIMREEPLGLKKCLFTQTIPVPPPLPPPPKMMLKLKGIKTGNELVKKNTEKQNLTPSPLPVRPSLNEIIASKSKLRKTNILS